MKFIVNDLTADQVTVLVPGSNYRCTFKCTGAAALRVGQRVAGVVRAPARKAEVVSDGGNYVEPLFGRPRRMQGRVVEQHPKTNELLVQVGYPVRVKLPHGQSVVDFPVGSRVGWDNADWPLLEIEANAVTAGSSRSAELPAAAGA